MVGGFWKAEDELIPESHVFAGAEASFFFEIEKDRVRVWRNGELTDSIGFLGSDISFRRSPTRDGFRFEREFGSSERVSCE